MMKKIIGITLLLILGLSSCSSASIDVAEADELLLKQKRGLVAGFEIGDNWEDIKKNANKLWTIREESDIFQLRKDWDLGNNMMYIGFELDEQKNVEKIRFYMIGKDDATITYIKALKKKFEIDYKNLYLSKIGENSWEYQSKEHGTQTVSCIIDNSDEDSSLNVNIEKKS